MAKTNGKAPELTFDLTQLTALDLEDVTIYERKMQVREMAKIYARIVATCPAAWGPADEPATYSSRPIVEFWGIGRDMMEAVKKEAGV